jgi:CBS domain-containing protein
MFVKEIMSRNVETMNCDETVLEAYTKYRDLKIGSLIIKDNDRFVGIVTERDLIERTIDINPDETKIREIMTCNIITINPLDRIETAAEVMEKNKIRKLPVISDDDKLVGIITLTDIALLVPNLTDKVEKFIQSWVFNEKSK